VIEFWLPTNAADIIAVNYRSYVRGSYTNPESDFTNEYLVQLQSR